MRAAASSSSDRRRALARRCSPRSRHRRCRSRRRSRIVSATSSGAWPNPFSRSAETGRSVAAATARECASASSRDSSAVPSGRGRRQPRRSTSPGPGSRAERGVRAEPASKALAMTKTPGPSCRARRRAALSAWEEVMRTIVAASRAAREHGSVAIDASPRRPASRSVGEHRMAVRGRARGWRRRPPSGRCPRSAETTKIGPSSVSKVVLAGCRGRRSWPPSPPAADARRAAPATPRAAPRPSPCPARAGVAGPRASAARAARVPSAAPSAVEQHRLAHEAGDEFAARPLVQLARRAGLRDHAVVHHDDLVAHRHRLALVVRDVGHRQAEALLQARGSPRASSGAGARRGSTAARRTAAPPARAPARAPAPRAAAGRPTARSAARASMPTRPTSPSPRGARSRASRCGDAATLRGRRRRWRARPCAGTARSSGTPC